MDTEVKLNFTHNGAVAKWSYCFYRKEKDCAWRFKKSLMQQPHYCQFLKAIFFSIKATSSYIKYAKIESIIILSITISN